MKSAFDRYSSVQDAGSDAQCSEGEELLPDKLESWAAVLTSHHVGQISTETSHFELRCESVHPFTAMLLQKGPTAYVQNPNLAGPALLPSASTITASSPAQSGMPNLLALIVTSCLLYLQKNTEDVWL